MNAEAVSEPAIRKLLGHALVEDGAPVLVLLEGTAGTGKSRLLSRLLAALPVPARTSALEATAQNAAEAESRELSAQTSEGPREKTLPSSPLVLAVEAVHQASAEELAALRALLADPPMRLACVLTYRPEELPEPGLVLGSDFEFPPALTVIQRRLGPWDLAAVERAATAALGVERCGPGLAAGLHRASGGNAQIVADLIGLLSVLPVDQPRETDVERLGVPPRLAALTLRRVAAVPEPHRAIVFAAAVLDEPATAGELTVVADLEERDGQSALLASLRTAALHEAGDGLYGFFAPLAAAAVRDHLPGPVKQSLHRRAAAVLARRQPVPWERLAAHRRACGDQKGWLRAVERAAQQHAGAGELQSAVRLLESVLGSGTVPEPARSRLAAALARSAVMGLRSDQTMVVLRNILADAGLAPAIRGEIRLNLGLLLCNQMGLFVEGQAELKRAVEDLSGQPVPLARAMSALAPVCWWPSTPLSENIAWIKKAVVVAAESGDQVVQAAVAADQVSVLLNTGDHAAWALIDRLPRDSGLLGCRQQAARGLCNAADAAVWLGHYERSRALLREGTALAVRNGAVYTEQTGRGTEILLDWATGRWAGLADRARAMHEETGDMPYIASDARMVLGLLALARGEWADTAAFLTGTDALDLDDGPVPLSATTSGALIRLALARKETGPAAAEAERAWQRLRTKGVWALGGEVAPWAVEASAACGALSVAREMVAELAAGLEGRDAPSAHAALRWTRGVLTEYVGDPAAAAQDYEAAAAAYAALPRPYHAALATVRAARCLLALDRDSAHAVATLSECAERFDALGAAWDAARTRAELRDYRPAAERCAPGPPGNGSELSPREAEVAALAGAGMTNREIATTLHLSPRTVEQHVARALQKSGVHSRRQLVSGHLAAAGE
ncbi:helix-turn-helix transcriptional regulator [Streptomyces sp. NPDC005706]|uniref:helix-turn-helix transcriptional regulator n=1 Tax=Streptomyces sp. NPDC005706 TaxID=3157169 RepID=UPI0033FAE06D